MSETILKAASMEDAINGVFTEGENTIVDEQPIIKDEVVEPVVEPVIEPIVPINDTIVEPVVEDTTVENVEIKTVEEPVAPVIQEKIVEKPIEFKDEHAEKLHNAIVNGDEKAVLEYLSNKYKDYTAMSTLDVLKEKIKSEKPHWDITDVEAELEARYGEVDMEKFDLDSIDKDLDADKYDRAERHNKEVDRLTKLRERDAKDARVFLESQKLNIELPNIQKQEEKPIVPQPTQAEIDESIRLWHESVDTQMASFSDLKFKAGNEEITYKITDEEKLAQVEYMKKVDQPTLFKDLGWMDENGNQNILKIAEDVQLLKNKGKIISSISTQMKTVAKKEVIAKDIKNLDLENRTTTVEANKQSFGDFALSV